MVLRFVVAALTLVCSAPVPVPVPPVSLVAAGRFRAFPPVVSVVSARRAFAPVPGGAVWPLSPVVVVRSFDPPPQPWRAGHRGVDLAGAPGATVVAASPGTVLFAGAVAGRGVVSVAHPGGLRTTYEPVLASVGVGDVVAAGEPVGTLVAGHRGCAVAACLHWGLRRGDVYLDPRVLVGLGRVRLLPLNRPG